MVLRATFPDLCEDLARLEEIVSYVGQSNSLDGAALQQMKFLLGFRKGRCIWLTGGKPYCY